MGVADYVMLGRTPHLGYLAAESRRDVDIVRRAMEELGLGELARRPLLDEPTASLDLGRAVEVLDVIDDLRREQGLTVVTAAHDLTLAGRYVDRLVLLSRGSVAAEGHPREVLTRETLSAHYGADIRVIDDRDGPVVVPVRSRDARSDTTD